MTNRAFLLLILAFAGVTMGANLGAFEADLMEARNFVTAKDMLTDGAWWETTMNGLPRLEKPPLPTWITAMFGSLSADFPLWLVRLPAMLMGLLLVVWTYLLGKSLFEDENKARWSAFVAASALLIIQQARTGSWDIYFVSFAIGSFVYLLRGLKNAKGAFLNFLVGGVLLGCSVLSKGPVAGIMLVGFGGGLMIMDGYKPFLRRWKEIIAAGILIGIIGFGWPVYNMLYQAEAAQAVIDKESVIWTTKHVKPFYFYIIFPVYMGIWAIPTVLSFVPKLARRWVGKPYWMLIIWIGLTIALLSLLPMKKERYLLPAMPAVALLVGSFLGALSKAELGSKAKAIFWASFGVVGVALALAPVAAILVMNKSPEAITAFTWIGAALLSICGVVLLIRLKQSNYQRSMIAAGMGAVVICALLLPVGEAMFYKNPNYISPATLMQNEELQNQNLYTSDNADMRVVYEVGQKLLPLSDGLEVAKSEPIYVIIHNNPRDFGLAYPDYDATVIDSSGHHKRARDLKMYAYKMQLK